MERPQASLSTRHPTLQLHSCLLEPVLLLPVWSQPLPWVDTAEICSNTPDGDLRALWACPSVWVLIQWDKKRASTPSVQHEETLMPAAHGLSQHTGWVLATWHSVNSWCFGVLKSVRGIGHCHAGPPFKRDYYKRSEFLPYFSLDNNWIVAVFHIKT